MRAKLNAFLKRVAAALCILTAAASGAYGFDEAAVQALLKSPNRELTDKLKDEINKPIEVVEFLQFNTGMTILDVYAADGYYSIILSAVVGDEGVVFAQNSSRALSYQVDRTNITAGEVLTEKIAALNLENIARLNNPLGDIELVPNSLDAVLLSKIFHDYYNRNPARAHQLLLKLKAALKPSGVIGIIDHYGKEGDQKTNTRFHRIEKQKVIDAVEQAGLVVEAESDLLRNPRDQHNRSIFEPMLNGFTDRFVLRVKKPE